MSREEVHIERIDLRFRGVTPEAAQEAASGVGPELMRLVADQRTGRTGRNSIRVGSLDAGTVATTESARPAEVTTAVARQIAAAIQATARRPPGT